MRVVENSTETLQEGFLLLLAPSGGLKLPLAPSESFYSSRPPQRELKLPLAPSGGGTVWTTTFCMGLCLGYEGICVWQVPPFKEVRRI